MERLLKASFSLCELEASKMVVLWGRVKSTCHIARTAEKGKLASVFELKGDKAREQQE
jgi:hypothetical protein